MDECCFIAGGHKSGKTNLGILLVDQCLNLIPNNALRSYTFQEISRFVTQGRNFGLGYIALTQRLASVDSNVVEIRGLKYFGKTEGIIIDESQRLGFQRNTWMEQES